MLKPSRDHAIIAFYLFIVGMVPFAFWVTLALRVSVADANSVAAMSIGQTFYQLWFSFSLASLALAIAYISGLASTSRGSLLLFWAVVLLSLVSAAATMLVNAVMLAAVAILAFRVRPSPN